MAALVGRADEVSQALAVLRRVAQRGDGAVLLVTGDAGIGKTAVVRAIAGQAGPMGYAVGPPPCCTGPRRRTRSRR
jgi:ATP-dependent Clp protease ATP-binding subunit ClpA